MRSKDYEPDVSTRRRRRSVREVTAEPGTVAEDAATGFCGAVLRCERENVVLEDARGRTRLFPMRAAAFLIDGEPVTLVRPRAVPAAHRPQSASGSVRLDGHRARVARAGRIWVEGRHDAELVERVWGHDLRVEGVVVEAMDGIDHLVDQVARFEPGPGRRLGVLADHMVTGSKEAGLAAAAGSDHVLITGHPYVDIWQAVRPAAVGIDAWPDVPPGMPWKDGVCRTLGWVDGSGGADPGEAWRRILAAVNSYRDLEPALLGPVERLIDFVTAEM